MTYTMLYNSTGYTILWVNSSIRSVFTSDGLSLTHLSLSGLITHAIAYSVTQLTHLFHRSAEQSLIRTHLRSRALSSLRLTHSIASLELVQQAWQRTLTEVEISAGDLIGYWDFDRGGSDTTKEWLVRDRSPNRNDGWLRPPVFYVSAGANIPKLTPFVPALLRPQIAAKHDH